MFTYFRERVRERESRGGAESGGGQRIQSGFCADSREPYEGLELTNYEIMT